MAELGERIGELVELLPAAELDRLESALAGGALAPDTPVSVAVRTLGSSNLVANRVLQLLRAAGQVDAVLLALIAVRGYKARSTATAPTVKLVWTGPVQFAVPARNTTAVLQEMAASAISSLTLVGYAITAGGSPVVRGLAGAVERGVRVRLMANRLDQQMDTLVSLWPPGVELAECYTRDADPENSYSALHAKLMVVDSRDVLVTSANLTYQGLNANVEVGVRVQHQPLGLQVEELLSRLVIDGHLRRI